MFALKIFGGGPRPGLWCVLASLGRCLARVKITQNPQQWLLTCYYEQ